MNIQDVPLALGIGPLPLVIISFHFHPFSLEVARRSAPLPPLLPADAGYPFWAQLINDSSCREGKMLGGNSDGLRPHPVRRRNSLRGEGLEILDGVFGAVGQEIANQVDSLIVGEIGGGLVLMRLAREKLDSVSLGKEQKATQTLT